MLCARIPSIHHPTVELLLEAEVFFNRVQMHIKLLIIEAFVFFIA